MTRLSPLNRISVGLVMLTVSILLTGDILFGVMSEGPDGRLEVRRRLTEVLAVQLSALAAKEDYSTVQLTLDNVVTRNSHVLSAAFRSNDGTIRAEAGVHGRYWEDVANDESTPTAAQVPIFLGDKRWGAVQIRYTPLPGFGFVRLWTNPFVQLICYVGIAGFVGYFLYMRRTLKHLDPSAVVPGRVRTALDALSEGVVLIDEEEQIVLMNSAFCKHVGGTVDQLLGMKLSSLNWTNLPGLHEVREPPWVLAASEGERQVGTSMCLETPNEETRTFMVNGSPILDDAGNIRGVLATFDDVTELEEKNNQLNELVDKLKTSTEEVNRQNERLQILAARDPLTNCLNRRAFFERSDAEFDIAVTDKSPISSIMLDIDHFKKVNDNYGHAVGDQVIQLIADQLRSVLRGADIIGRYGGEEFCVLLPGVDIDQATLLAERLREAIEQFSGASRLPIDGNVTISLGVSTINSDTSNATDLIDQADKGLYASKNNGRNQVTRWDAIDHSQVA